MQTPYKGWPTILCLFKRSQIFSLRRWYEAKIEKKLCKFDKINAKFYIPFDVVLQNSIWMKPIIHSSFIQIVIAIAQVSLLFISRPQEVPYVFNILMSFNNNIDMKPKTWIEPILVLTSYLLACFLHGCSFNRKMHNILVSQALQSVSSRSTSLAMFSPSSTSY